jgi:hypothetical protein
MQRQDVGAGLAVLVSDMELLAGSREMTRVRPVDGVGMLGRHKSCQWRLSIVRCSNRGTTILTFRFPIYAI